MPCRRLIKGRCDHFALHGALHLRHLFGPFVDQQHHHVDFRVVGGDGMRDVLHHHRLAALGRCYQQGPLSLADRCNDVDDPPSDVLLALDVALELHLHLGKKGRQILEHHLVFVVLRATTVDLVELVQRKVAFTVLGCAYFAFDHVSGMQIEAADLAGADIDVVGACGVTRVRAAQEPEAVGQYLQHPVGNDLLAGAGPLFDDGEHQLLLAHAAGVFYLQLFCLLEHFRHV